MITTTTISTTTSTTITTTTTIITTIITTTTTAAPQVGKNIKLMVFNELGDPNKKDNEMILINPKVTISIINDSNTTTNTM